MARFVLILINSETCESDFDPMFVQTDDIRETLRSMIADQGVDIICDTEEEDSEAGFQNPTAAALDEMTQTLMTEGKWGGEDGSYCVACVDKQREYETTV